MRAEFKRSFKKQFKKLPKKVREAFGVGLDILLTGRAHSLLRIHALKGDRYPLKSMNITGDYRALFVATKTTITFYEIGTHSELYE